MTIKTIADVAKLQKDLGDRLQRHIDLLGGRKAPSLEALRKDQSLLIERAEASLKRALQERDEVLRSAELRVQHRREELERLKSQLQDVDRGMAEANRPATGVVPVRPTPVAERIRPTPLAGGVAKPSRAPKKGRTRKPR